MIPCDSLLLLDPAAIPPRHLEGVVRALVKEGKLKPSSTFLVRNKTSGLLASALSEETKTVLSEVRLSTQRKPAKDYSEAEQLMAELVTSADRLAYDMIHADCAPDVQQLIAHTTSGREAWVILEANLAPVMDTKIQKI